MPNNILSILLILFSILLAFGKLDPIFSLESSVNTIDVVILTFLVAFFITRFNDFLKSIFSKNFLYIFLIFFLFVFAQILNGYSELVKPLYNLKFVMCGVFFVSLISIFKKSPLTIHHCLIAFSVSSFIYSIFILFISPDLYQIVKGQMIVLDENPNSTSSRLAIAIIYILYFVIQNPLKWGRKRLVFVLLVPSLAAMVVMSGSRGSLLAVLLGAYLIFIFSDINKIKKIVLSIFSFFCSLFLFKFLLSSDDLGGRWEKALGGDTAGRTDIWEAVLKIAYAKPLGVGETGYVENITNLYGMYIDTHNIFLYILVCGGWLSLIFFIMFLISIFKNSFSCYMNDREILPLIFLFIMLFIAAKTGGVITFLLFWFILAAVASYRKI